MKIVIHYTKRGAIVCAVLLLAIGAAVMSIMRNESNAAPSRIAVSPVNIASQKTNEGPVDVTVEHNTKQSTATTHTFTVVLNTHSGDLSTFDAQTNVVYRLPDGSDALPQSIDGDRETHHRTIITTFANATLPGTVIVKNLRGIPERTFPITN